MIRIWAALFVLMSLGAHAGECLRVGAGEVSFTIEQMGAPFMGEFTEFGGELCLDGDSIELIDVWLRPASIDTGLADLDAALQAPELFHSDAFDRVVYRSTDVARQGDHYVSNGLLEMKGIARPLSVLFRLTREGSATRVSGEADLKRLGFEVGTGEWADTDLLGDLVTMEFSVAIQ